MIFIHIKFSFFKFNQHNPVRNYSGSMFKGSQFRAYPYPLIGF